MGQTECRVCSTSDPAVDTVKVSIGATLLADADAGKASSKHQAADVQHGPVLCQEYEESARREAEELSLREEQQEQERRRQREEERHRLAEEQQRWQRERTEAQAREEEEERHRLGSEAELSQRLAAEAAARRAEEERQRTAEEKAHKEAKKKVEVFLKARGFKTMVMPRTTCFKATYPLHVAVQENSADVVSAFLLCGADKKVKNSSGKTPLEVAQKLNNKGSHQAVIAALA
mmetsp:Transcript_58528/g.153259  ORF Transcript_58528/g.153259 Transcript_58528/m.153259 type:complete len:233 (+) Transcript_58528:82-780(+)